MLESVSFNRILPPIIMGRNGVAYRDKNFLSKISNSEIKQLEDKLLEAMEIDFLHKQLNSLEKEKEEAEEKKEELLIENRKMLRLLKKSFEVNNEKDEKALMEMIKES